MFLAGIELFFGIVAGLFIFFGIQAVLGAMWALIKTPTIQPAWKRKRAAEATLLFKRL